MDAGQQIAYDRRQFGRLVVGQRIEVCHVGPRQDPRFSGEPRGRRAQDNEPVRLGDKPRPAALGGDVPAIRARSTLTKPEFVGDGRGHERDADELRVAVLDRCARRRALVLEDLGERESAVISPEAQSITPGAEDVGKLGGGEIAKR